MKSRSSFGSLHNHMKYPRVATLHSRLNGDWDGCYHLMHSLAIAIETEFSCQQLELDRLKSQVVSQQATIDGLLKAIARPLVPVTPPVLPTPA